MIDGGKLPQGLDGAVPHGRTVVHREDLRRRDLQLDLVEHLGMASNACERHLGGDGGRSAGTGE